jgi:hypothetical protein
MTDPDPGAQKHTDPNDPNPQHCLAARKKPTYSEDHLLLRTVVVRNKNAATLEKICTPTDMLDIFL